MSACQVCGKEDLFSFVTRAGVCAPCTLLFNIPDENHGAVRLERIEAARLTMALRKEIETT